MSKKKKRRDTRGDLAEMKAKLAMRGVEIPSLVRDMIHDCEEALEKNQEQLPDEDWVLQRAYIVTGIITRYMESVIEKCTSMQEMLIATVKTEAGIASGKWTPPATVMKKVNPLHERLEAIAMLQEAIEERIQTLHASLAVIAYFSLGGTADDVPRPDPKRRPDNRMDDAPPDVVPDAITWKGPPMSA